MKTLLLLVIVCFFIFSCSDNVVFVSHDNGISGTMDNMQEKFVFTGKIVGYFYNGLIQYEEKVREGIKHGLYVSWHENGRKKTEGSFVYGKREGVWKWWNEKGEEYYEVDYHSDIANTICSDRYNLLAFN